MAVFGVPQAARGRRLRAVRAAKEDVRRHARPQRRRSERLGVTIAARISVHTGEVDASEAQADQRLVTGDAVSVAARLEQHAAAGEILLGETTYRLVRGAVVADPVVPIVVKGKASSEWPLGGSAPGHSGRFMAQRRLDAPQSVGREEELAASTTCSGNACQPRADWCRSSCTRRAGKVASRPVSSSSALRRASEGDSMVTVCRMARGDLLVLSRSWSGSCWVCPTDDFEQALGPHPHPRAGNGGRGRLSPLRPTPDMSPRYVAGAVGLCSSTAEEPPRSRGRVRRLLETTALTGGPLVVVIDDIQCGPSPQSARA